MIGLFLNLLVSRVSLFPRFLKVSIAALNFVYQLRKNGKLIETDTANRFMSLLRQPVLRVVHDSLMKQTRSVRVIIVVAEKDFPMLEEVVAGCHENLQNFNCTSMNLVVPSGSMNHKTLLDLSNKYSLVRIIDENYVLNTAEIKMVFAKHFYGRENWCLQQFLKFFSVLNSESDYALVVDADTVLLRSIPWITNDGKIILMPTAEYQEQYYRVLINLGVIDSLPEFSFVPHHMFYSMKDFRDLYESLGKPTPKQFAQQIESSSDKTSSSPFCIDYELYAQFMANQRRDKVELVRWANLNISRHTFSKVLRIPGSMAVLRYFFNSVSVHSWRK